MSVTYHDAREILRIIEEFPATEIRFEHGDLKLHVRRANGAAAPPAAQATSMHTPQSGAQAAAAVPVAPPAAGVRENVIPEDEVAVRSPMMGLFYRAPSPGAPPFVEVGQKIKPGTELCIIEVMKVMNTLKAPCAGTITGIFAENAASVGKDAILFSIEPFEGGSIESQ